MKRALWLALGVMAAVTSAEVTMSNGPGGSRPPLRITVVYNNVPHSPGLATAWGFAAVVETVGHTVLFDTGADGQTLLANLRKLDIDPRSVDTVVLSHMHGDHTGGLDNVLARRSDVTVYVPRSTASNFCRALRRRGARVETVGGAQRLFGNVHSTGEMGRDIREQALILETRLGLVVMTGCAHPGIVAMAKTARDYLGRDIYLLMGGFHLLRYSPAANRKTIDDLRRMGVRKVAPSHCTGDEAIAMFRSTWGKDYLDGGCGAVIEVP
jgi:7,8-dihydropterin-6-yl-methyl-4-(beta-D-ribofuranosyl)aminobenzene 5'-phosphate synthase